MNAIKRSIPWAMASTRAALGPIMILGAACGWNGIAMAGMVVLALVSDIFDGILARRWDCDTAAVRLFDTLADTLFYLCTAWALWLAHPEICRANATPLGIILGAEVIRYALRPLQVRQARKLPLLPRQNLGSFPRLWSHLGLPCRVNPCHST